MFFLILVEILKMLGKYSSLIQPMMVLAWKSWKV